MKSADGTRTQFLLEKDKKGNSLIDYKITDKNGKILMSNSQTFEVIDDKNQKGAEYIRQVYNDLYDKS